MFPIKQLNQPPNDSFHRHLGNYRSLLFTSGDETAWAQPGWGWVVVGGGSEDRVRSEWMKTKRQGWRAWRWSRRCNELNLTVVNGLVQEKPYFRWLNNEANKSPLCEPRKQLTTNVKKTKTKAMEIHSIWPFKEESKTKVVKRAIWWGMNKDARWKTKKSL